MATTLQSVLTGPFCGISWAHVKYPHSVWSIRHYQFCLLKGPPSNLCASTRPRSCEGLCFILFESLKIGWSVVVSPLPTPCFTEKSRWSCVSMVKRNSLWETASLAKRESRWRAVSFVDVTLSGIYSATLIESRYKFWWWNIILWQAATLLVTTDPCSLLTSLLSQQVQQLPASLLAFFVYAHFSFPCRYHSRSWITAVQQRPVTRGD